MDLLAGRAKRFLSCSNVIQITRKLHELRGMRGGTALSSWVTAGVNSITYNMSKAMCAEHAKHPVGAALSYV